jgi:hypothetical protein
MEILELIDHLVSFHDILSIWYDTDRIGNTASDIYSTDESVFVAVEKVFTEPLPIHVRLFRFDCSDLLGGGDHTDTLTQGKIYKMLTYKQKHVTYRYMRLKNK